MLKPVQLVKPQPLPLSGPDRLQTWSDPWVLLDLGGDLAVWHEVGDDSSATPWLVLHGGPGGRLSAAHVAPLRSCRLPWFGFDQRNSGLSEDLDLSVIDLQRFIDDALAVADHFGFERFNVLGGSWGGTLAMALAAYKPNRISGLVLRAPFIPWRVRVDAFFAELEKLAPEYFMMHFGRAARSPEICQRMFDASSDLQLRTAHAWSRLENALLGVGGSLNDRAPALTSAQESALLRKYRLQAHFLWHECFLPPAEWAGVVEICNQHRWPVGIVQGIADKVCPPAGAAFLSELIPRSKIALLDGVGHLPDSTGMFNAVTRMVEGFVVKP